MRINKYLSDQGICSRRQADELIKKGRIFINGNKAKLGDMVSPLDAIVVNGKKLLHNTEPHTYIMYNKPIGVECTVDQRVSQNILTRLGIKERIYPIGRLDKNTTGLLLLTSDGSIVNAFTHPRSKISKEYIVEVNKEITPQFLRALKNGVRINAAGYDEEPHYIKTQPAIVHKISDTKFSLVITEGKNRQVRKMCEAEKYRVRSLHRSRIGKLILDNLELGAWRRLTDKELEYIQTLQD